jgi:hypothetical protein
MTEQENERAARIAFMMQINHEAISTIYENLVDREYDSAVKNIKQVMRDLRATLKLIEDDDF